MTDHPITPPPKLVRQWARYHEGYSSEDLWLHLATQAARWGADQELDACCKAFEDIWDQEDVVTLDDCLRGIRAARRPKPTSLKEQALAVLDDCSDRLDAAHENAIRRALETLPE